MNFWDAAFSTYLAVKNKRLPVHRWRLSYRTSSFWMNHPQIWIGRQSRDLRDAMQLWKSQGKTIIISEHRLWYLKDIIDRAVYMEKGRIVNEWTRQEFSQLTEKELKSYELRPVTLEERYIRQFSNVSKSGDENPQTREI